MVDMSDNLFQQCMCQLNPQKVVNYFSMKIKTSIEY